MAATQFEAKCNRRKATNGKREGTHRDEKRAKSTKPVVPSDYNNALGDRKNCCVVEKERTAALLKAAAVEKNHGGQRARAGGGRSKHVEVQAILGLNTGDIRVVMVLQAARAISAREFQVVNLQICNLRSQNADAVWRTCYHLGHLSMVGGRRGRQSGGGQQEGRRRECQGSK
jgi:hypothetical protein